MAGAGCESVASPLDRIEFRLLGPIGASLSGRPLALGGRRQRALLALLLLHRAGVVSTDRLVEELWSSAPPPGASKTLRAYVSRLRKLLRCDAGVQLRGVDGGYVLSCDAERIDAVRFERLAREGAELLRAGDARAAADRLDSALATWSGSALGDVAVESFAQLEAVRLEELRLSTLEDAIDAGLALGQHAELVAQLIALTGEHPLRERMWAALMVALYRSDRRADALDAYARARAHLVEELGLEPGEHLRDLQGAILRDELPLPPAQQLAGRPAVNLPAALTSFVGREHELGEIQTRLRGARLVTLTGLGGAGKTRLALEVAGREAAASFVDLGGLVPGADVRLVARQVADALGLDERGAEATPALLAACVGDRPLLVVLDNCEHVAGAAASLAGDLLRHCPGLRILATSRQPLGVPGERTYAVPPLALDADAGGGADRCEAVALFLDRAAAIRDVEPATPAQLATVARICRELDGLPLAIELAAGRVDILTIDEIAAHLSDRFRLLRATRGEPERRHAALRDVVESSHDLMRETDRAILRRLASFAGGFDRDAIAEVCCDGDAELALDGLTRLVQASLVSAEQREGVMRYHLLESVRLYARERLDEAGERDARARLHARHFLRLAEASASHLHGADQEPWLARLHREHDNLRAALRFSLQEGGDPATGAGLVCSLLGFWRLRGHYAEARSWCDAVLQAGLSLAPGTRERVLAAAAALALLQCDYAQADELAREALALLGDRGDGGTIAGALRTRASVARERGAYAAALELQRRCLEIWRDLGNEAEEVAAQIDVAFVLWLSGDAEAGGDLAERTLERARSLADRNTLADCLLNAGAAALHRDSVADARASCRGALTIFERLGNREGIAWARDLLGVVALREGDLDTARSELLASLTGHLELGDRWRCASVLESLAMLACDEREAERAAKLFGAADAVRESIGAPIPACEREAAERCRAAAQASCGPERWTRAWSDGRGLHPREARDLSLGRRASGVPRLRVVA